MIVDDDRLILRSLKQMLEFEGYEVCATETGQQTLERIKDQAFDLAVLDIKLPDMEGTRLLEIINETSPETVKVMLTGYATLENAVDSLNLGADAYLMKPVDPQQLLQVIKGKLKEQEDSYDLGLEKVRRWIESQIKDRKESAKDYQMPEEKAEDLLEILDSYNQMLQEKNRMLEHSNADLENYSYVVSHDLKAPLRSIRSFGTILLEDYSEKLDETGRDYLRRIVKASEHMNELIEDLLTLSRVGRKFTMVERVDLNNLLDEVMSDLRPTIERRNAEVVVSKLPTILTQKTWIKQLFMNLIDNGLKFNKSDRPRVAVQCDLRAKEYLFSVSDNGIGIEKQHLERIFSLFVRLHTKEEYEGTGAGLAICKRIVEHFGGKIWAESTFGKGSTFYFAIPKKERS